MLGLSMVILGVAAWVVPLPVQIARPERLVAAGSAITITIDTEYARDASLQLEPVDGQVFAVQQEAGAPLARTLAAALDPASDVLAASPASGRELDRPVVVAAVLGLGLSPARMEGAPLPVELQVDGPLDESSVGVALLAFDATSALDVVQGRQILGLGEMGADQRLSCQIPPAPSVASAQRQDLDVLVLPEDCAAALADVEASAGDMTVIVAATLVEAIDALLAQ